MRVEKNDKDTDNDLFFIYHNIYLIVEMLL